MTAYGRGPAGTHTRSSPCVVENPVQVVLKATQSFCVVQRRKHCAWASVPVRLAHTTLWLAAPGT